MDKTVRQEQQVLKDYACINYTYCKTNCIRKVIFLSPNWFSGWIEGNYKDKEKCEYYQEPKSIL